MLRRVRFIVRGQVQGVGYRWFCAAQAERLGIAGSASNEADGTVEVVAQADPEKLEQFRQLLAKGPRHAVVTRVDQTEMEPMPEEHSFHTW